MTSHNFLLILVLVILTDVAKSAPGITFCGNLTESEKWFSGTELKIEPFPIEVKEGKELSIEGKISLHQKILSGFAFKAKLVANDNLDICKEVKNWPITKFELHKKEPTKLELQKNELIKFELHKFEPLKK